jgi:hypothetical protein
MIQEPGIVSTGAAMFWRHPLQVMTKSCSRAGGPWNMPSIAKKRRIRAKASAFFGEYE